MFDKSADRMNEMMTGDTTKGRADEAKAVVVVMRTLGVLLGSLGVPKDKMDELSRMDKQTGPQALFVTALLDAMDAARAGLSVAPKEGICAYRFDRTACVDRAGHDGPHTTSNERFPHGLVIGGLHPSEDDRLALAAPGKA
jgi:hypothetical protein